MKDQLNDFLDDGAAPEPEQAPEPVVIVEPVPEPVVEPVAPEKPPEDDLQPGARVPVAALQAERRERQDWKEKAVRAETELAALRPQLDEVAQIKAQLAELQKARSETPPVPVPPPVPEIIPNPVEDPQGFIAYQRNEQQKAILNERLNLSEAMLREQHGDDDVNAKVAIFKKAAEKNPALVAEAYRQPHPYKWVYAQAQRMAAMEEIGTDPTAYRTKIEAEARAKWEAEMASTPRAPEPVLPQSLATARNSGARLQEAEAAPEFEDIFKRKPR